MKLIGKDTRYLKTCRNTNENAKVSQRTGNARKHRRRPVAELLTGTFRFASGILPAIPETICPGGGGPAKCIKEYKGKLRSTKEYEGILRNTKKYQGIQGIPRHTKEY